MTCDFTSFLTVFQSYKDDERLIMKGCVQWNPVYGCEDFASSGARTLGCWISRPALNPLSYRGSFCVSENVYYGILHKGNLSVELGNIILCTVWFVKPQ